MVPCYGISKDEKGNYIMVMEYMNKGNLREYLKKNRELDLERKLNSLKQITQGLKDIHRKKLVHRDFHSGNIIVDVDEYGEKYNNEPNNRPTAREVSGVVGECKPINTKQIIKSLQVVSQGIPTIDIPTDIIEISELEEQLKETNLEEKGETSLQAQIEIPPKNN
ncbi:692_t:CDS:2 [Scutellospora calospora]|uniref:692_t:CDS:1 n=1 Tax=Scutellospora calospora TaxID=85575 RepID=A0ACA9LGV6_9GLOM|nr:692_t:CDS:2 [Scutellospora calospora]